MNPLHLINLTKIPNMGQQRIRMFMSHLGEEASPFEVSVSDLCRVKGINQKTARDIKAHRDIFAALGRITDKHSIEANRLIRNGAIPVTSGDNVIREINPRLFYPVESVQRAIRIELTDQERIIMDNLGQDPVHIDELANTIDMNISSLLQILLKLELKNAVQQIGGKQFPVHKTPDLGFETV